MLKYCFLGLLMTVNAINASAADELSAASQLQAQPQPLPQMPPLPAPKPAADFNTLDSSPSMESDAWPASNNFPEAAMANAGRTLQTQSAALQTRQTRVPVEDNDNEPEAVIAKR